MAGHHNPITAFKAGKIHGNLRHEHSGAPPRSTSMKISMVVMGRHPTQSTPKPTATSAIPIPVKTSPTMTIPTRAFSSKDPFNFPSPGTSPTTPGGQWGMSGVAFDVKAPPEPNFPTQ